MLLRRCALQAHVLRHMGIQCAPTNCAASLQSLNGTAWTKRCATVLKAAHCWRTEGQQVSATVAEHAPHDGLLPFTGHTAYV